MRRSSLSLFLRHQGFEYCVQLNEVLPKVWEEVLSDSLDGEMHARSVDVETQKVAFEFLFGLSPGLLLVRHTNNLSKSL